MISKKIISIEILKISDTQIETNGVTKGERQIHIKKEQKSHKKQSAIFLSEDIDYFINVYVNFGMNGKQSQSGQPSTSHGVAKYVFKRFNAENDLSADALVTGTVSKITISVAKFGNMCCFA